MPTNDAAERRCLVHRIGIVDNDPYALASLRDIVNAHAPHGYVAWEAESAEEAFPLLSGGHIDLLITDMSLEGIQGPSLCRYVRLKDAHTPILGVTSFAVERYREPLVRAGAQGLVAKSDETGLVRAIAMLLRGKVMVGFERSQVANERLLGMPQYRLALSQREESVIELCANDGLNDEQIAERLHIRKATVRKHMQHIMRKLNCRSSRQAVAKWIRGED